MDRYTEEILSLLKKNHQEAAGVCEFQSTEGVRKFYLKNLQDNLYKPMMGKAEKAYGEGSGNEIASGKMNALRSSSALTYNLLWNGIAEICVTTNESKGIKSGIYEVEFEKQYHTLKSEASRMPANLDAFLYCNQTKEAIACEMKMTEWIFNKPGNLRQAYLEVSNYIDEEAGKVFVAIAKSLILNNDYDDPEESKEEYPGIMSRYDAFQMFKHTVACYTACTLEEPREIRKLTLLNCVWMPDVTVLNEEFRERYAREVKLEIDEFKQFKQIMNPIKRIFENKGILFDVDFITVDDFMKLLRKTDDELKYLRRYTF